MDGIKAEQVRSGCRIAGAVVDVNDLDAGAPPERPKNQATDPPEAVDADAHGRQP